MANIKDAAILNYKKAYSEFFKSYENLTKENVKTDASHLRFRVTTAEPINVYLHLAEIIHSVAVIYDKLNHTKMDTKDQNYIKAFSHIDNIIKHEHNQSIEIDQLISSTPTIHGGITLIIDKISQFTPSMSLTCFWKDISFIPCASKNKHKRNLYNKFLRNKKVSDTLIALNSIIEKYT